MLLGWPMQQNEWKFYLLLRSCLRRSLLLRLPEHLTFSCCATQFLFSSGCSQGQLRSSSGKAALICPSSSALTKICMILHVPTRTIVISITAVLSIQYCLTICQLTPAPGFPAKEQELLLVGVFTLLLCFCLCSDRVKPKAFELGQHCISYLHSHPLSTYHSTLPFISQPPSTSYNCDAANYMFNSTKKSLIVFLS